VQKIISLGVEKVAISAAAIRSPEFVSKIAEQVGSQSVVVVLDVKKKGLFGKYYVQTHNGTRDSGLDPVEFAQKAEKLGAGEIVINSVDLDGVMSGYDTNLVDKIRGKTKLPLTILGGAGSLEDISGLYEKFGIVGAAAGSLFVFKGVYKAVLINYPNRQEKLQLFNNARQSGTIQ
jgi:cyclase